MRRNPCAANFDLHLIYYSALAESVNRYYLVGFSLLVALAVLVILVFVLPQYPYRTVVLTIVWTVLRYLVSAGIGYGSYRLARKHFGQKKAIVIGIIAAVSVFLAYILLFTFVLPILLK
jgi:hypothetical protein